MVPFFKFDIQNFICMVSVFMLHISVWICSIPISKFNMSGIVLNWLLFIFIISVLIFLCQVLFLFFKLLYFLFQQSYLLCLFLRNKKHFYNKSEFIFTMSENMLSMLDCLLMAPCNAYFRVVSTLVP